MEEWRDIKGYEGLYQVSSEGRVKSLDYNRMGRTQVLKPQIHRRGYLYVYLHQDGKAKKFYIHRLVAQAFLANAENLTEVNHRDEDKTNNAVSNLEWCTAKDNSNHGTRNARMAAALTNGKLSKPVQQLTKDGVLVAVWPSSMEAWRQTGINQSHISQCCNGHPQHRTAGGFIWRYVE